ncbi:MAG: hypothetical protein ABII23_01095 [bacterium]
MNRKVTNIPLIVLFGCLIWSANHSLFAVLNHKEYLERGIAYVMQDYDAVRARQEFKYILDASDVNDEIKIQAFYWMSYSYLFEGNTQEARHMLKEVFKFKNDAYFEYDTLLDQTLLNNGELMRLFNIEFKEFFGFDRIDRGTHKQRIKEIRPKKKYMPRIIVFSGIVIAALLISFL